MYAQQSPFLPSHTKDTAAESPHCVIYLPIAWDLTRLPSCLRQALRFDLFDPMKTANLSSFGRPTSGPCATYSYKALGVPRNVHCAHSCICSDTGPQEGEKTQQVSHHGHEACGDRQERLPPCSGVCALDSPLE